VVAIALVPTLIYVVSVQALSTENAGIDIGSTAGAYFGLFLLAAVFTAIGVCCSSFTSNAVVAFIISALVCLLLYIGFSAISEIPAVSGGLDYYVEMLGIDFHYQSVRRGVVDSRDLVYFLSLIAVFLFLSYRNLVRR
jgi:ABC-2 type transport system permease protein